MVTRIVKESLLGLSDIGITIFRILKEKVIEDWTVKGVLIFLLMLFLFFLGGCGTTKYVTVPQLKEPKVLSIKPTIVACPTLEKATQTNFVEVIRKNYRIYNACRNQTNNIIIPYLEEESNVKKIN